MEDRVVCGRIGDAAGKRTLRVDWHSLLDELPHDFPDDPLEYDSFAETKDYVSERLDYFIERLSEIAGQVRSANRFEELDLGWWAPLIEQVEDGGGR